ncbi:MAG TPA: tyrosine-type recombinase/integrase, partial [Syntrophorhabdales bacterium]|nr:tyrosine-type recombinase/integrase [Syntrophorhabdales bacterium]
IIPIHPEMYDHIADRVKSALPEAFLFPHPDTGRNYYESALPKIWEGVRTQAGIGPYELRLYDASRHSFASQLANSGTTLFHISKALGHSTQKMSERYSHQELEKMRANLSKISLRKKQIVTSLSPAKKARKKMSNINRF